MPNGEGFLVSFLPNDDHLRSGERKHSIRILIADGNSISRDGLRALLQQQRGYSVVGEAADTGAAVALVREFKPDVLLLDMAIPQLGGIEVLRQLATAALAVRVVALTTDIGTKESVQALSLGAHGMLLKSSPSTMLFEGIRRVMGGGYWVSPDSIASLVERLQRKSPRVAAKNTKFGLTGRELEVIGEVVSGCSNPEIANKLTLSEQTVKHHLTHVFDKLGVYSRVELALFAVNHKLCDAAEDSSEPLQ